MDLKRNSWDFQDSFWCYIISKKVKKINQDMESKKVKIQLPKNCEVEDVNARVEDKFIVVEYTPKKNFEPKDGDIIVTDGLICISDGTILDIGYGVYCARLRKGGFSYHSDSKSFSEGYKNDIRLATDIEKKLLFSEMERYGLKWNPKNKKIEKIRWTPKYGELYFYIDDKLRVRTVCYYDDSCDRIFIGNNNCFRTEEETNIYIEKIRELLKNRE